MAASTDVTGDHLETLKGVNDQMQEISVQRPTLYAKYFEHRDGFEDTELEHEYFDEIHQESFGNDLKSEYSDLIHDGSLGNNKDSKLGPALNPKQVREKKKNTRCRDTCTERVHHESFGNRNSKVGPCPTPKEVRKKDKKTKCKEEYLETIHHESFGNESFGNEDYECGSTGEAENVFLERILSEVESGRRKT